MTAYRVTRHIKELGMMISTIVESDLSIEDFRRKINKPPKGLRKPLSPVVAIRVIDKKDHA